MVLDDLDRPVTVFTSDLEGPHGKPITGDPSIRLVRCVDPVCSEVVEQVLATSSDFLGPRDLDVTPVGRPIVAYGYPDRFPSESGVLICSDESCADVTDVPLASSDRDIVHVTTDGMLMLASEVNGTARLSRCLDPFCADREELASIGEGEGNLLAFELTETDLPMFARQLWGPQPEVEITWCESESCDRSRRTVLTMVPPGEELQLPVATFDSHHHPVLVSFGPRVGVVTCGSNDCTDAVYSEIGPGRQFSLSGLWLTDDDRPVLAYRASDPTGESWMINVATCDDPACTSGTVATITDFGWGASSIRVVLDDAGNPVVGYVRWSLGETYVYRCLDPRCEIGALDFTTFGDSDGVAEERTPVAPPVEGWTRIAAEAGLKGLVGVIGGDDIAVFGLQPCGGEDVAPGEEELCPVLALSPDGLEWEWYHSDEAARNDCGPVSLGDDVHVVGGQRCVGSGDDMLCIPIVSTLHEGSWTVTDLPCDGCEGWIDTFGTWSGGLIAYGSTRDGGGLWLSADGFAWTRVGGSDPFPVEPFPPQGRPFQFIEMDGLKAYGSVCMTLDCQRADGALWVSADGETWSRDNRLTGLEGFVWGEATETVDGLLVSGQSCASPDECDWALMYSSDGVNWRNVTPHDAPAELFGVFGVGDTVIALGGFHDDHWGQDVNILAETSDLETWTYWEIPLELGRFGEVAVVDGRIVAVGFDDDGLAIWVRE